MASDTRSGRKNKEKENNKLKNKPADPSLSSGSGKIDTSGLRRSGRETKPVVSFPRKSERLGKQSPSTPVKTISGVATEKQNTPNSLRRSDRGKKHPPSSPSRSSPSGRGSNSSIIKKKEKKEKSVEELIMESERVSTSSKGNGATSAGLKRKKMDGRSYKALFKTQKIRETTPETNEQLERPKKSPRVDSISSDDGGSEIDGDNESHGRVVPEGGASAGSICSVEASDADASGNDVEELADSSHRYLSTEVSAPPAENGSQVSNGGCTGREISGDSRRAPEDFAGTCASCSRRIRLDYDSPEEELCSCDGMSCRDYANLSSLKDRAGSGAAILLDSGEGCNIHLNGAPSVSQRDDDKKMCAICKQGGEILSCHGRGCKRCFHPSCLDPPLDDFLSKAWHCTWCVKKKIESGVHSVTEGVESILDVREVEVAGSKGMHRQKQYLVKYQGLAHAYNHWVAETQLPPFLFVNYDHNNKDVRWNLEWRLPHRLLKKRSLIFSELHGHAIGDNKKCISEWLVKWRGLDYKYATWELENAKFLNSQHGESLIKDFNIRREKAKRRIDKNDDKRPHVKLSELSVGGSLVTDSNLLNNVNKLRECWSKFENTAVFVDQDRIMKIVLFIQSLSGVCRPFLIITSSNSLSHWEAEFTRWAPTIDFVVYSGSRDSRRRIKSLEFYDESGLVMLQVLLSSREDVIEDVEILSGLSWEVIIIDECQNSGTSSCVEQIKKFLTGLRVLLYNCPMKTASSELLSLLDCKVGLDKTGGSESNSNENLGKLKEQLSKVTAHCTTKPESSSKFVEYWVPLEISDLQLEKYCSTLLKSSDALRSFGKSDPVGVLHHILVTVRKCCSHPYIEDMSLQPFNKGHSVAEILEIGIEASGKLQLLDKMLWEMKLQRLRVIVLFQSITDEASIADILEDFLLQRFGKNAYERVETRITPSIKQAALNRFYDKESECFVLLLENRACSPSIKLASIDSVIIYDSDTNPTNDLRHLQKLSIDSQPKHIKVFRPYSCFTVEERALVLAKQDPNLDNNNLHSLSRSPNTTLMWGASNLFSRLDKYHSIDGPNGSSRQLLLNDVISEFSAIISNKDTCNSIISKVQMSMGSYSANIPLFGEKKIELRIGEEPHDVFWRKLLEGRNPQWRKLSAATPRNRKRVSYFDESQNPHDGNHDVAKKRRKVVNHTVDAIPAHPSSERDEVSSYKGAVHENDDKRKEHVSRSSSRPLHEGDPIEPEGRMLYNEQKNLHIHLKIEFAKLFQVLKLSEDVQHTVGRFLEYVMEKYRVPREPATVLQAFQISLCWIAASISKQKIDKEETFLLAKQHLQFGCTEGEADSVYRKIRSLKKAFLQRVDQNDNSSSSSKCNTFVGTSQTISPSIQPNVINEMEERLQVNDFPIRGENLFTEVKHRCERRMSKLVKKQKEEIEEFRKKWEKEKEELEEEYKVRLSVVRYTFRHNNPVLKDRQNTLEIELSSKLQELKCCKDQHLNEIEGKHSAMKNEEMQKAATWLALAQANFLMGHSAAGDELSSVGSDTIDDMIGSRENINVSHNSPETVLHVPGQHIEEPNAGYIVDSTQCNPVASDAPASTSNESNIPPVLLETPAIEELVGITSVDGASHGQILPTLNAGDIVDSTQCNPVASDAPASTSKESNILPVVLETPVIEELVGIASVDGVSHGLISPTLNAGNIVDRTQYNPVASDAPASTSNESNILPVVLETPAIEELVGITSVDGESAARSKPLNEVGDQDVPTSTPKKSNSLPFVTTNILRTPEIEEQFEIALTAGASIAKSKQPNEVDDSGELELDLPLVAVAPADDGSLTQNQSTGLNGTLGDEMLLPENQSRFQVEVDAGTCEPNNSEAVLIDNPKQQQPASDGFSLASHDPKDNMTHQNHGDEAISIPNQGSSHHSDEETVVEPLQVCGNLEERPSADFEALPPSCNHPNLSEVNRVDPQPAAEECAVSQNADTPVQVPDPPAETPAQVPDPPTGTQVQVQDPTAETLVNLSEVNRVDPQPVAEQCAFFQNANPPVQVADPPAETLVQVLGPAAETPVQVQGSTAETPVQVQGPAAETLVQCASPPSFDRPNLSEVSRVDPQPIAEQRVISQNAEAPVQVLGPFAETSAVTVHPAQQMATRSASLSFNADPLHKEWERMQKEREQTMKFHEDMKVRLKSECEKEIEKMIAEIRKKYDLKLQEVEEAFLRGRNEVDIFQNKVLLNKMLADAFRAKCMNLKPSGLPGMHQGVPSGYMQHLRQVSQQQSQLRSFPVTDSSSPRQPSSTQASAVTGVSSSSASQPRRPAVTGLSLAGQQAPTQVTAAVSRSTPLSAGRPPFINAITPSTGNLRVGGEIRAPAPHLQPFRPPSSNIAPTQPLQHQAPTLPLNIDRSSPVYLPSSRNTSQHDTDGVQSPFLSSARELLINVENQAHANRSINIEPPLPDMSSNFDSLDLSEFQALESSVQGGPASSDVATGVVCLSDDE